MQNGSQEPYQTPASQPSSTAPVPAVPSPSPPARPVTPELTGPARQGQRKSPLLASVLSLMPGIGQVYVGYYKLGFVHNLVFAGTIMLLTMEVQPLAPLFGVFLAFFFVYNVVDAGRRAAFYNMALDGVEGIQLPEEMNLDLSSVGGSVGGGLALIALGAILLSNTALGWSLEWVEQWWPLAPMALGGYLVVRALQERRDVGRAWDADEAE